MTAEIGVLNTLGVALAADSAVTFNSKKIFNTADKLFSLSKHHPVGIMIYGNANLMGVPWESVIKIYRKHLGDNHFNTLDGYCADFYNFIQNDLRFQNKDYEKVIVVEKFNTFIDLFLKQINSTLNEIFGFEEPTENQVLGVIFGEIDYYVYKYGVANYAEGFDDTFVQTFVDKYEDEIKNILSNKINISLDIDIVNSFLVVASDLVYKFILQNSLSGVVFAGFGEDEIFPSLKSYLVEGVFDGKLKYKYDEDIKISATKTAAIVPFAQQEMVHAFLTGVEPDLKKEIERMFDVMVNTYPKLVDTITNRGISTDETEQIKENVKKIVDQFKDALARMIKDKYSDPIIGTVSGLPKEELASMAEALINLTSIKRKMSSQLETVGGPIDVAVISKGDGFIWIKRKHYFSPQLNHSYFSNYLER